MERINEMARIGWIPSNQTKGIEVYVHTDDNDNVPHFHVRKYGSHNDFEWEVCVRYDSAQYFSHGRYGGIMPTKITKMLDKMLREKDPKSRHDETYWEEAIDEWNRNNSDIEIDKKLEQPDYSKLNYNDNDFVG